LSQKSLAIVVPVYRPMILWQANLYNHFQALAESLHEFSVKLYITIDGGFTQQELLETNAFFEAIPNVNCLSYSENMGKGFALRKGIAAAQEDYIVYTDIDLPYTQESMLAIIESLAVNDVTIGIKNKDYYKHLPTYRVVISKILRSMIGFCFPKLITSDTQCGLKGMRRSVKELFLKTTINRYLFDLEFVYYVSKSNFSATTIPVQLREGIEFRNINKSILLQELYNFARILMHKN
jgi:glycosyltransferase involved in cell wall biosynthesis